MNTITVSGAMRSIGLLPVVDREATLLEAIQTLRAAVCRECGTPLLAVRGGQGEFEGVVSIIDVIRGLDPKYAEDGLFESMLEKGFSEDLLESFMDMQDSERGFALTMAQRSREVRVEAVLRERLREEVIEADAPAAAALDTLVLRQRQYLLVVRGERLIGVIDGFLILDAAMRVAQESGQEPVGRPEASADSGA